MEFLKDYVPESFRNVILSVSFEPNNHFNSVIRTNVNNYRDCDAWIAEFGRNTKTKWIVRHTKPKAQRLICRKKYVCHHSDFMKKPNEVHGRKSKNFSCKAFINIRVKLTTSDTKKKDRYIRDGLPAVITMNNYHSHDHLTSAALAYLPPSDEVRSSFERYFSDGLGLREAISVHEAKLQLLGLVDLTDASINPRYDTVKYWLSNWRKANLLSHCEPNDSDQGPSCSTDAYYEVVTDNDKSKFEEVVRLMKMQNDRFGTSNMLVNKVLKRLRAVNSSAGWNAFLNSAGSNLIVCKRKRKSHVMGEDAFVDNELNLVDTDSSKKQELFVHLDKKDVACCIVHIKKEEER